MNFGSATETEYKKTEKKKRTEVGFSSARVPKNAAEIRRHYYHSIIAQFGLFVNRLCKIYVK